MATYPPKRQAPKLQQSVIDWLLDSDPAIRWQVMRDLTDRRRRRSRRSVRALPQKAWVRDCLLFKEPTGRGAAGHGIAGGTPPCMS